MNLSNIMKGLATAFMLCAALPANSQSETAKPLNVGKQFNCKVCHVNRLKELKKGDRGRGVTGLAGYCRGDCSTFLQGL